jgi:zinc D-Ala-D-Ala carboxypeptidase
MTRPAVVPVLLVAVLVLAGGASPAPASAEPTTGPSTTDAPASDAQRLAIGTGATAPPAGQRDVDADTLSVGAGAGDSWSGYLPDGTTLSPFDTSSQLLLRLNPALLKAIQDATRSAQSRGVDITITSGWRSKGFQQRLFDDAVRTYGSVEMAQQFVASPETSRHVLGEAVDIAGDGASAWLIRNGAQFGLCQIYANENWHFELATDGAGRCPPLRPNAAG